MTVSGPPDDYTDQLKQATHELFAGAQAMTREPRLPDGSSFFVAVVPTGPNTSDPIKWNPWNKVVQDHRDGTIHHDLTNKERAKRGLPVPWTPEMGEVECHEEPKP